MATIVVPLKEFRVESDSPVDLTSLPKDQAVALVRKTFGFLSSSLQIAINGDAATITLPPANVERADEALRLYQRGVKQAEKGEYLRAIKMFQQVLSELPEHVDARRNLGMAYQEAGDKQLAKQYLLETLRLDSTDAWSHLLLGNIYSKQEKNYVEAEKHYQRAYELKPVDAILLTNYGAMRAEQGRLDDARRYFEEAVQADARSPTRIMAWRCCIFGLTGRIVRSRYWTRCLPWARQVTSGCKRSTRSRESCTSRRSGNKQRRFSPA